MFRSLLVIAALALLPTPASAQRDPDERLECSIPAPINSPFRPSLVCVVTAGSVRLSEISLNRGNCMLNSHSEAVKLQNERDSRGISGSWTDKEWKIVHVLAMQELFEKDYKFGEKIEISLNPGCWNKLIEAQFVYDDGASALFEFPAF